MIDWSASFDVYLVRLEQDVTVERATARPAGKYALAALEVLQDLAGEPVEETPTLKWVRQSGRHRVWRVAHPFDVDVAVRLIAWFPPDSGTVVVALFARDTARVGNVWYDSVGTRADVTIGPWKFQTQHEKVSDDDDQWREVRARQREVGPHAGRLTDSQTHRLTDPQTRREVDESRASMA